MAGSKQTSERKLLENPILGSLVVPIAIVLVGALIIFGVTQMLSTDRGYKDLVRELQSKTFGNRWIAAYELSKVISTSSVPPEDVPWLVENLADVYKNGLDPRTRDFVIVAMGALRDPLTVPYLLHALGDADKNVQFHALVALGNLPKEITLDWTRVITELSSEDHALKQAAILALATHRVAAAEEPIVSLLNSDLVGVKYAAATGLIKFKNESALPILREVLESSSRPAPENSFDAIEVEGLKFNILHALEQESWPVLLPEIEKMAASEGNSRIQSKALQVLNRLKN